MKRIINIAVIAILATFLGCKKYGPSSKVPESENSPMEELSNYRTYVDSATGITFQYLADWKFERKLRIDTGEWEIVGNGPTHGYLKQIGITISERESLDDAVMDWWLVHDEGMKLSKNKVYIQRPRTHRYKQITYAANRAQIKVPNHSIALDYRVMAVSKKGKTIIIWERAEIGGLDGFEADGFIIIEETTDIVNI